MYDKLLDQVKNKTEEKGLWQMFTMMIALRQQVLLRKLSEGGGKNKNT